ncbi:IclR family transcriptional regulator [Alicyclobacillus sp. SO9]|uniref:IclR family transcriptional regulator n=1 Tax=Alicyclobacillus sp. SO9 TaxID=2665646 RepID=UPI0018E8ABEE|nr:IclR family transcriptional regulator [Alicyclobacillus sp. SO9]QQE77573.1 IclR family transcriptional regulator [Alicyclobacillus sp. SO9]
MNYRVPSVSLAMKILKLLSRYNHKSSSLKEIAELTGVNKTTCLRVLRTLQQEDFVKYDDEKKKYSLGPYLIPLGNRAKELNDVVSAAILQLSSVSVETGCTSVLIERLRDDRLIFIASEESPKQEVKISVSIGQQFPLAGAGIGRCFLAYDGEQEWQKFIETGLVQYTRESIVDKQRFVANLMQIQSLGYAVSHGEMSEGISAVAVPIFNQSGQVELVMACMAVTSEFHRNVEQRAVSVLMEKAKRLSEWNGYQYRGERFDTT